MASLKVVVICSLLLTSLLAPALARIYIVDDGLPDGGVASRSASQSSGGGSSSGLQLSRSARDAAGGQQQSAGSSRGRKKYKDTLAEADVRAQEAFEALRTVEKRIRQATDPSTDGLQTSRPEQYRRRKPQQPPPTSRPEHVEEGPTATSRSDEVISRQHPTGVEYGATGPSATGPSSEGADYDDDTVNQEAQELLRVAPQQQPPTASNRDPSYPVSSDSSETNQLPAGSPSGPANSVQYMNPALGVTTVSPHNVNLAYSTVEKDSDNGQIEFKENNRNSLHFTPFDSRINPYVKTIDHVQYTQVSEPTSAVSPQLQAIRNSDGRSDRLENQISSSYSIMQPVSDNPSMISHAVKADAVVAYIRKKYEDQLPAANQQQAYSFQEFNNGQTVVQHSGRASSHELPPSTPNAAYTHVTGTDQIRHALPQNADQNNEVHINQQLLTAGGSNAATFQSPSKLNSRPHFDDGRPSEDSHRLVHTGPMFKFTLDDRMTPPTGYDSREHNKETKPFDVRDHSGEHVGSRKGKSMDFNHPAFGKQGSTREKEEDPSLEGVKSQESTVVKVQYANVGSTPSVPTEVNNSQSSDSQRAFRPSIAVASAGAFQGDLRQLNIGGLVVTSAPALGSKVQRDTESFLGNQVSASRTVTGTLKFAPSASDQTAMASASADQVANFLSVSSDHHQTQKRTTTPALSNDHFTLTVGANVRTGSDHEQPLLGENREARFSFPQSTTNDHQRMVFPDKAAHDVSNIGYTNSAALDTTLASHQMLNHGQHSQGFRHQQPQNMYVQRLRPQRQPGSDIVYGSPPRPGAGRVQRPWGLARPVRGAPHPHRQRRPLRGHRPLRLHKVPTPPAAGHVATAGDSMPSSSSVGNPVALPAASYGSGSSPPHVSFVEAGPWGQFRWSVSHDVALKPALHWR